MSVQIFKRNIPDNILFSFLERNALKNAKYFIFNKNSYKKAQYNESLLSFIETCRPYYHLSKRKYVDKKQTYNTFVTILRQICNYNKITYTSQIKYDKSEYEIVYYICYPVSPLSP